MPGLGTSSKERKKKKRNSTRNGGSCSGFHFVRRTQMKRQEPKERGVARQTQPTNGQGQGCRDRDLGAIDHRLRLGIRHANPNPQILFLSASLRLSVHDGKSHDRVSMERRYCVKMKQKNMTPRCCVTLSILQSPVPPVPDPGSRATQALGALTNLVCRPEMTIPPLSPPTTFQMRTSVNARFAPTRSTRPSISTSSPNFAVERYEMLMSTLTPVPPRRSHAAMASPPAQSTIVADTDPWMPPAELRCWLPRTRRAVKTPLDADVKRMMGSAAVPKRKA